MRLSTRSTMAVFATLLLTGAAFAAKVPHTSRSSTAPLIGAWTFDGSRSVPAQLECGGIRQTAGGPTLAFRNTGDQDAFLVFAGGSARLLEPGQELELVGAEAIALSTNKCVCKCTCTGADGSQTITFDCASSTGPDQCPTSDGSDCSYFDASNHLHDGTTSGCKRKYIPIATVPEEPVTPVEP